MENLTIEQINKKIEETSELSKNNYQASLKLVDLISKDLEPFMLGIISKYIKLSNNYTIEIKFQPSDTISIKVVNVEDTKSRRDTNIIRLRIDSKWIDFRNDIEKKYLNLSGDSYSVDSLNSDYILDYMSLYGIIPQIFKNDTQTIIDKILEMQGLIKSNTTMQSTYQSKINDYKAELSRRKKEELDNRIAEFIKDKTSFDFGYGKFYGDTVGSGKRAYACEYRKIEIVKRTPKRITLKGQQYSSAYTNEFNLTIEDFDKKLIEAVKSKFIFDAALELLKAASYLYLEDSSYHLTGWRSIDYYKILKVDVENDNIEFLFKGEVDTYKISKYLKTMEKDFSVL